MRWPFVVAALVILWTCYVLSISDNESEVIEKQMQWLNKSKDKQDEREGKYRI